MKQKIKDRVEKRYAIDAAIQQGLEDANRNSRILIGFCVRLSLKQAGFTIIRKRK